MRRAHSVLAGIALGVMAFAASAMFAQWPACRADGKNPPAGEPIAEFVLSAADSRRVSLYRTSEHASATVIAFTSVDCPVARLYSSRLASLHERFRARGVCFIGIDPSLHVGRSAVLARAREAGIDFPILLDSTQAVAERLSVKTSTEVLLLDSKRRIRYRGAIDDQYAVAYRKPEPTRRYLADAIDALLASKPIDTPRTEASGCIVARAVPATNADAPTFSRDVAPIIYAQCVDCHRPGQVGPMSFLDYETAASFAPTIAEVTRAGRMPPWHANPEFGDFENERRLTETEKSILSRWAEAGAPKGDAKLAPAPPAFAEGGWAIGVPDLVIELPEPQRIPAEGTIEYRYVLVDPRIEQDRWVQAVEVRPSNPAVTHHVLALFIPPGKSVKETFEGQRDGSFIESGYFAVNVPGSRPNVYPEGTGKRLPAGSKFLFQLHYTPNGTASTDRTRMAFRWAVNAPTREVHTRGIFNRRLDIAPGDPAATFHASHRFKEPVKLLTLFPHMHARGKAFRFELCRNGAGPEVLLDVPEYDFGWQNLYALRQPRRLEKGDEIALTAVYDNSPSNPRNPDPKARVRWGDQTWDEMLIGYVDVVDDP